MATVHCYLSVENLALTAGQKTTFHNSIAALGANDHPNPSHRNHSVTNGEKRIFEAEFTDAEISTENLKALLATALAVEASTISVAVRETNQGVRLTYTESAQDKVRVEIFGYSARGGGRPTKLESNVIALAYIKASWGGGTLVSGVPRVDPDFSARVDAWWDTHPLNPAAPYPLDIVSPATVIDVEVDHGGDLQAAIDAAGEVGAKLVLGAVYYSGDYEIIARRHLHFIGQAGTKIKAIRHYPEGTWGADYGDLVDAIQLSGNPNHAAALAVIADPPCDFYFADITFDGNNEPFYEDPTNDGYIFGIAVAGFCVRDVLFDRCIFQNYSEMDPPKHHGPVSLGAYVANILFRDCTFYPPGLLPVYLDGLHGGGIINSLFANNFKQRAFLALTNHDVTYDYDGDGEYGESDKRSGNFVVLEGNTYTPDIGLGNMYSFTGQHILVKNNTVSNHVDYPFIFEGASNAIYNFRDIQVTGNTVVSCKNFVTITVRTPGSIGDVTITGNEITTPGAGFLGWTLVTGGTAVEPITVSGNTTG